MDPLMNHLMNHGRGFTEEEREAYKKLLKSVSKPTGINRRVTR